MLWHLSWSILLVGFLAVNIVSKLHSSLVVILLNLVDVCITTQYRATDKFSTQLGIVDRRPDIKASAKGNASAEITEKR